VFLCEAAAATDEKEKADRLVLWTTPRTVVLINRYPYTNGHLLIAPRGAHRDLELLDDESRRRFHSQTARAIKLLKLGAVAAGDSTSDQPRPLRRRGAAGARPPARRAALGRGYELLDVVGDSASSRRR
jgi:hypothetical protein